MRLFHFSEDPGITRFEPRPVLAASTRKPGRDWLNGPLVWGIEESHAFLYLFPRDCPRILVWPTEQTTEADRQTWMGDATRAVAYVESGWLDRIQRTSLYRYDLPTDSFEDIEEVGMWISRSAVTPTEVETLADLPALLADQGVTLRPLERLTGLRPVWDSSLHASGVRLRNAVGWT